MIKRILPLAFAAVAAVLSAPARAEAPRCMTPATKAPARTAESTTLSTEFGYCGDLVSALAPNGATGTKKGAAMQVNAAIARKYAGAQVTAVLIANGTTNADKADPMPIDVFCSTSLNGAPTATASGSMDLKDFGAYTEYRLDKPVDIELGKTFYVGYTFTHASSSDYPVAIDYTPSSWPGCFIGTTDANGQMQWESVATQYGMAGIRLRIEGDNLPQNKATLDNFSLGQSTLEAGVPVRAAISVTNDAANAVSSVGLSYTLGGSEAQIITATFANPIPAGGSGITTLTLTPAGTGANQLLSLKVAEVNGQAYDNADDYARSATVTVIEEGTGFRRNVVVEERTGTWCPYCPRGIVGMEKMKQEITDGTFIPIAVHVKSTDPMMSSGYAAIDNMLNSAPAAMLNRNFLSIGDIDPNYNDLKQAYEMARRDPAAAEIVINSVTESEKVTTFDISTRFALSESGARYRIALVGIEDNVGPYPQENAFANSSTPMDGWESKPSPAMTVYNDVARIIKSYQGISSTVPTSIEAGTTYSYTKGSLDNTKITDRTKARYVALLINSVTGRIENAASIASPSSNVALKEIGSAAGQDDPATARYFNLQGQPVENPAHGQLLIRVCGSKTTKIIF